ncbi:MAG TPA: hypothetical protein VEX41_00180 [Candidatus Eisenbacteria bacterium]|nr:hypothetical protein [Candidatus Eisenbacteria bacterium]
MAVRSRAGMKARAIGWTMVAALLLLALGAPSSVAAAPGNNGTIKVHDTREPDPEIKNEPHVDCPFHLHFFFADAGQTGDWRILEWAPGDKGTQVWSGSYTTNSNGEYVTGDISLDEGHYKLFWEGDPNARIKHKAFWVDSECTPVLAPAPTPTPTPVPGATPTPVPAVGAVAQKLPDTSMTTPTTAESDGYLWQLAFAGLAGLLAAALVLSPALPLVRRRIRR